MLAPLSLPRDPPFPGRCEKYGDCDKEVTPGVFASPSPVATRLFAFGVRSVHTRDRCDLPLPGLSETCGRLDQHLGSDPRLRDIFRVLVWRGAAQQYIYRSPGFAILLAFLGINILSAALIRYPWKKRQTGFVITHAGLLTLLLGSYYSVRTADEGQVGMLEGDVKGELVRIDYPVIRVLGMRSTHTGAQPRDRSPVSSWSVPLGARKTAFPWIFPTGAVAGFVWVLGFTEFHRRGFDPARRPVPVRGQGALARVGPRGRACR